MTVYGYAHVSTDRQASDTEIAGIRLCLRTGLTVEAMDYSASPP
jgi:hypothetical protein